MTQNALDRAVSRATGEDMREIRHRGFGLADPLVVSFDPEPCDVPQVIDWDGFALDRNVALLDQRQCCPAA